MTKKTKYERWRLRIRDIISGYQQQTRQGGTSGLHVSETTNGETFPRGLCHRERRRHQREAFPCLVGPWSQGAPLGEEGIDGVSQEAEGFKSALVVYDQGGGRGHRRRSRNRAKVRINVIHAKIDAQSRESVKRGEEAALSPDNTQTAGQVRKSTGGERRMPNSLN